MATYGELFQQNSGIYYGDYGLGTCASEVAFATAYVDQHVGDTYQVFTDPSCRVNVHAMSSNTATVGNLFAFWPSGAAAIDDATVTSIIEAETGPTRQGHVHRLVQQGNRVTGVAVVKNVALGAYWLFNVYLFDSAQANSFQEVGSVSTFPLLQLDAFNAQPYPWIMKTRLVGDQLTVKVWPEVDAEPAWTDTGNTATYTIPANGPGAYETSASGMTGWFAGELAPDGNAIYSGLNVTAEVHTAQFTGQRRSYSAEDLLDLAEGVGQVHLTFRFEVLDLLGNYQFEVNPPTDASMSIRVDTESTVKRTLDGFRLTPKDALLINPFAHRLAPIYRLETGDEWALGVFLFDDKNLEHNSRGTNLACQLTDQTTIIDQPRLGGTTLQPGASVWRKVVKILNEFRLPYAIPPYSGVTVRHPLTWKPGESAYTILAKLFKLLSWYPPYFDSAGLLRGRPIPARDNSGDAHVYTTGNLDIASGVDGQVDRKPSRIFDGSLTETDDLVHAPNRYIVTASQTKGPPISGRYVIPASAPHSRSNRGYWVNEFITVNGIENKAQADRIAENHALHDLNNHRWYEFSSLPDPRHDIFDRVLLNGELCIETGHTMGLTPSGPHSHKVQRLW